ncbi:hypothetical protein AAD041_14840 [Proteus mirabilis]|uniref:hypothetical protein n=1 Tax=Proteus mirabilis TaxID=584 RepID=UPI0038AC669C
MATVVESLIVSLKLDNTEFGRAVKQAIEDNEQLSDAVNGVGDASKDAGININIYTQQTKKSNDETDKAKKKNKDLEKTINGVVKALSGLFTTIFVSTGLQKLIDETSKTNDQLYFLSKNLGMNATDIKRWQNMAEMTGGSADGMAASLSGLSQSLWNLVTTGDASILPWFNALNVDVVNSGGQIRDLNDILLDVSDSLSKMSRPQAYNIAKNMGFDDGTINLLLEGRQAMQQMLETQKHIVISSEEELKLSRQLNQQNALVSKQWEGLKTLIANYLMPYFLRFSEKVSGWLDYLNKNREVAKDLFKGMAVVLTVFLIPALIKGAIAMAGMFAPLLTGTGLVIALGAALILLYRDYKRWKEGKDSYFDWSEWSKTIETVLGWLDGLSEWFKNTSIGKWFTDQDGKVNGWKLALGGLLAFFTGKFALGFGKTILSIGSAFAGLMGWPGVIIAAVAGSLLWFKDFVDNLDLGSLAPEMANVTMTGVKTADALSHVSKDKSNAENANIILSSLDWLMPGGKAIGHITEEVDNKGFKNAVGSMVSGLGGFAKRVLTPAVIPTSVEVSGQNKRVYKSASSDQVKEGGSRSWRNNNPGNIEYGDFAKKFGAIGTDGRFAIFPDEETGRKAKEYLIFESNGGRKLANSGDYGAGLGYKDKTLSQAITAYAPPDEKGNITGDYIKRVLSSVGVEKRMGDYTNSERLVILEAMKKVEGWREGSQQLINKLDSKISSPLVKGGISDPQNFLSQTQKLNSNPTTVNNKTDVNIGDINITSTAPTIKGTIDDGRRAARESLSQIMPTMT